MCRVNVYLSVITKTIGTLYALNNLQVLKSLKIYNVHYKNPMTVYCIF